MEAEGKQNMWELGGVNRPSACDWSLLGSFLRNAPQVIAKCELLSTQVIGIKALLTPQVGSVHIDALSFFFPIKCVRVTLVTSMTHIPGVRFRTHPLCVASWAHRPQSSLPLSPHIRPHTLFV